MKNMANETSNPAYYKEMAAISAPRWTHLDVALIHERLNSTRRLTSLETAAAKIPFLDDLCYIVDTTHNPTVFIYGMRVLGEHRLHRDYSIEHAYSDDTLQEKVQSFRG